MATGCRDGGCGVRTAIVALAPDWPKEVYRTKELEALKLAKECWATNCTWYQDPKHGPAVKWALGSVLWAEIMTRFDEQTRAARVRPSCAPFTVFFMRYAP